MFPCGEVNLTMFPQIEGVGFMTTYILFCGGKSFQKSNLGKFLASEPGHAL